jgi:hypothetical protein
VLAADVEHLIHALAIAEQQITVHAGLAILVLAHHALPLTAGLVILVYLIVIVARDVARRLRGTARLAIHPTTAGPITPNARPTVALVIAQGANSVRLPVIPVARAVGYAIRESTIRVRGTVAIVIHIAMFYVRPVTRAATLEVRDARPTARPATTTSRVLVTRIVTPQSSARRAIRIAIRGLSVLRVMQLVTLVVKYVELVIPAIPVANAWVVT